MYEIKKDGDIFLCPRSWHADYHIFNKRYVGIFLFFDRRLEVVSNFGHSSKIHTRTRKWDLMRRCVTRKAPKIRRVSSQEANLAHTRISPESSKLETTHSLLWSEQV